MATVTAEELGWSPEWEAWAASGMMGTMSFQEWQDAGRPAAPGASTGNTSAPSGPIVHPGTGRPIFSGPNGEVGWAPHDPNRPANAVSWTMPDGRIAYYVPGGRVDEGNLYALTTYQPPAADGGSGGSGSAEDPEKAYREAIEQRRTTEFLKANFQWLDMMGLSDQVREWITEGLTPDGIVAKVRQTPQHKRMFMGIYRDDGTLRYTEAQYLLRNDQYREKLRQYGRPVSEMDDPADFVAFHEMELDPEELGDRLELWDTIENGGQDIKDTFYVYAGLDVTTDDLYRAAVNPSEHQRLIDEYNQNVAAQPLDYETWISRATQAGLQNVVKKLETLQGLGVVTGAALEKIRALDPNFARQMMGALYRGSGQTSGLLDLASLERAFEYAMIGSAASEQGLRLPDLDRIEALRQAGVDRQRAIEGYSQFAQHRNMIQAMVHRAGSGIFGQTEFEEAVFLNRADRSQLLQRAQSQEEALAEGRHGTAVSMGAAGLQQAGLRTRWG